MTQMPPAYQPAGWLRGGHLQTIYPLLLKGRVPAYTRERWETPDGDFIDLDWLDQEPSQDQPPDQAAGASAAARPLVVLFHGLEGSSRSHYAIALMKAVARQGWGGVVPHFRGCSGELNRLPRAYHSGDSAEIDWILRRLKARFPQRPLYAAGVSLGGNALLKWLGEQEFLAQPVIAAAAAVCPPLDLSVCGHALGKGFNRLYSAHFLHTLKRSAEARLTRFPDIFDVKAMRRSGSLRSFDDAVTAPLHGFAGVDDYWRRASSKPLLGGIRVPTLVLNPVNDPFLPAHALPGPKQVSLQVRLEQPAQGGHVGFVSGGLHGHLDWLPARLLHFFKHHQQDHHIGP